MNILVADRHRQSVPSGTFGANGHVRPQLD